MARGDRSNYESYQKDAFDNPPKGPIGVHRGNTSLLSRAIPYFIVVVVAVLAGLLVWGFYSGELQKAFTGHSQSQSQTVTTPKATKKTEKKKAAKDDTDTKSDTKSDADASTNQQQAAPQPTQQVNKQTAVQVINATHTNGYAAKKKAVLVQAGYSSVTAGNATGNLPSSTVVWYQNDNDKATAQDVANTLGIQAVEQQSGIAQAIVVMLLN
ncbi:LytR C-terminal domain-containing protein [Bifidobacterium sp. ESL0798]|uniref:LytR C-terminal domain-containing protein n=1 Tax=unclassified Bifidobacterium TaxID=2608897 RepID=UPI0023F92FBF|nr:MULTISPECIES: LytR C-terminal domain-containing protein [unclassified Bifidobacterium]WEV53638.1 LytR C-terminal domain-containing protein [Bifidobacterium sp. ESL0704]WEV73395.1 LytR C-terminal domain-containing protein [Bifidobacterium sp. ESL0798]